MTTSPNSNPVKRYLIKCKYGEIIYSYGTSDYAEMVKLVTRYATQPDIKYVSMETYYVTQGINDELNKRQKEDNRQKTVGIKP